MFKNFVHIEIFKRIQSVHPISFLSGKQEVEVIFWTVFGGVEQAGNEREEGRKCWPGESPVQYFTLMV